MIEFREFPKIVRLRAMDFDHRTNKVNNVGTMVAHGYSKEKVMAEIAKCDLVCANCHRVRTRDRRSQNAA